MAALGSLVVSLGLDAAEFVSGLTKAEFQAKKFGDRMRVAASAAGTSIAAIGLAASGAVVALDRMAKQAAAFKDLEEETGASAEGLASIAVAADTAGVSMESIAQASIKLTKNLTGVDDESKAAGAALKALGLNIEDFKKLDPVGQTDALTKAFAQFADGAAKTAVATALWGRSGAEQLKVMKALEEQGGRTVILTQQQIEQADAYADAQAKATAELRLYAVSLATEAAPALLALTTAARDFIVELLGIDSESRKLGGNTGVKDFAEGAVRALAFIVDAADGVIRVFQVVGKGAGALLAIDTAIVERDFGRVRQIISESRDDIDKILSRPLFSDRLNTALGQQAPTIKAPDTRKTLDFDGVIKSKKAKKEVDDLSKAIQDLDKELALFGQDESFVKAFNLQGLGATNAQLVEYRANLAKLKELKTEEDVNKTIDALIKERDAIGLTNEQVKLNELILMGASEAQIAYAESILKASESARKQVEMIEDGKRLTESVRTPYEKLNAEINRYRVLLDAGALSQESFNRLVAEANRQVSAIDYGDAADKAATTLERLRMAEDRVNIARQSGAIGEFEALRRLGEERQKVIAQLEAQVQAQEAIAKASGSDRLVLDAERARLELEKLKATAEPLAGLFEDIFIDSASNAFEDFINGSKSASEAFKSFALSVLNEINRMIAADLAKSIFGSAQGGSGGGFLGSIAGAFASFFGGGRAVGGPVGANGLFRVNENRRPEMLDVGGKQFLMMGNERGRVIPNAQLSGGRQISVVNNFTVSGMIDKRTQDQLAARAASSVGRVVSRSTA